MREWRGWRLEESFARFERAAAKGHEESIWIVSVVKDVEMNEDALWEAFVKTEEPLGWWFAGLLSEEHSQDEFDLYKKSGEGGCSWGQVMYGRYFYFGLEFVGKDEKVYLEWLEKAANQSNPLAMSWLGDWFRWDGGDKEKAVSYYRVAAELGQKGSMQCLVHVLRNGEGCTKDPRQAAIWSVQENAKVFWDILEETIPASESRATEGLDCNFDQLCFALGWGLYWYQYGAYIWKHESNKDNKAFGNRCLDYYCSCVELQQKSIFTFLLFWNRTTGVKGPGQMIAQMVWEGREDNLVQAFEKLPRRSARLKRIKN
jgi:hypothetical protein